MKDSFNDGGPVYPLPGIDHNDEAHAGFMGITHWTQGMSLRDLFAANALSGCEVTVRDDMGFDYFEPAHEIAKRCYEIADAMLKARQQ
jgi:hypothetical protein